MLSRLVVIFTNVNRNGTAVAGLLVLSRTLWTGSARGLSAGCCLPTVQAARQASLEIRMGPLQRGIATTNKITQALKNVGLGVRVHDRLTTSRGIAISRMFETLSALPAQLLLMNLLSCPLTLPPREAPAHVLLAPLQDHR